MTIARRTDLFSSNSLKAKKKIALKKIQKALKAFKMSIRAFVSSLASFASGGTGSLQEAQKRAERVSKAAKAVKISAGVLSIALKAATVIFAAKTAKEYGGAVNAKRV